ncbi:MAG: SUMF1/EgtB/PvdO family nonheme iron enzyme [Anaerolineaceae bacterium]|nr:SUMF1/EgtB/PvdO family nonheme iron enzyme [Anaerolineaceae bacterium]
MPRIFISYRRADSNAIAGRIHDRLVEAFGEENVFKDVDDILPGSSFAKVLEEELQKCDVLLIIIGQRWVNIADADGLKRLDNPEDFVRIEVERGLARHDLLVIPVMVDDAKVPTPADLPGDLAKIPSLQVVHVRNDPDFNRDMIRLVRFLESIPQRITIQDEVPQPPKRNMQRILIAALFILIIGFLVIVSLLTAQPGETPPANPRTAAAILATTQAAPNTPDETGTINAVLTELALTATTDAQATIDAYTDTPLPPPTETATPQPTLTPSDIPPPTPNQTITAEAIASAQAAETRRAQAALDELATQNAQLTANAPTNTPQPTNTPTFTLTPTNTNTPTNTPSLTTTHTPAITPTPTYTPNSAATQTAEAALATNAVRTAEAINNARATQTTQAQATRNAATQAAHTTQTAVAQRSTATQAVRATQTAEAPPEFTMQRTARVSGSQGLNVRLGAGTNFAIVTTLTSGDEMQVIGESGSWLQIRLSDGRFGWVFNDLVTVTTSFEIIERNFDGITMVFVPPGCFMMGSNSGDSDEQPVQQICFNEPFWIDKTEVTQSDFSRLDGQKTNPNQFIGNNQPVENINWFEARDFCDLRGMRLPTEAEWEYAARGPESLIYPWGNTFIKNNVVYLDSSDNQTHVVGSHPSGASWIGALDMSGNVWEWVSSLYRDYPYLSNHESNEDINNKYVLRGGSFYDSEDDLRTANRFWKYANFEIYFIGFRCAKSAG